MSCSCEQQQPQQAEVIPYLPQLLAGADDGSLMFFIQGVKVGMNIRAAEQAKWTRLGIILAIAFGTMTFLKHQGEDV
jgi:hypothetical protein